MYMNTSKKKGVDVMLMFHRSPARKYSRAIGSHGLLPETLWKQYTTAVLLLVSLYEQEEQIHYGRNSEHGTKLIA